MNRKIIHLVIHNYPGTRDDYLGSKAGIYGRGNRHPITPFVSGRNVRGVFTKQINISSWRQTMLHIRTGCIHSNLRR